MNIDERLGITWKYDIPFREKYGKVVALIGLENLKPLMPEDVETLAKNMKKIMHLITFHYNDGMRLREIVHL